MLGNAYVRITNNFLHDMATGTWAACLMVLVVLSRRLPGMPRQAADAVCGAMGFVFWLLISALIVNHIAFLMVYGGGTVWGWLLLP